MTYIHVRASYMLSICARRRRSSIGIQLFHPARSGLRKLLSSQQIWHNIGLMAQAEDEHSHREGFESADSDAEESTVP